MLKIVNIGIALLLAGSARAHDEFKTWRINGGDIHKVVFLPAAIRTPGLMRIIFKSDTAEHQPLVIVSDTGIDKCYEWAKLSTNNKNVMLEITQLQTAKTTTGHMLTSCFAISSTTAGN